MRVVDELAGDVGEVGLAAVGLDDTHAVEGLGDERHEVTWGVK